MLFNCSLSKRNKEPNNKIKLKFKLKFKQSLNKINHKIKNHRRLWLELKIIYKA